MNTFQRRPSLFAFNVGRIDILWENKFQYRSGGFWPPLLKKGGGGLRPPPLLKRRAAAFGHRPLFTLLYWYFDFLKDVCFFEIGCKK